MTARVISIDSSNDVSYSQTIVIDKITIEKQAENEVDPHGHE